MVRKLLTHTTSALVFAILLGSAAMIEPTFVAAADKEYVAFAKCPSTGKSGQVTRATRRTAKADAIKLCLANGS